MNSNSSWGQLPSTAARGAAETAAATAAEQQPTAAQAIVDAAVCAEVAQRIQQADDFWQHLETAAAVDVGPQRAKRFVAAFKQAHDKKVQEANLEQADQLVAQIFSALQEQQE
ncbi:hypothetical protein, conserved [Eimeria maxima]|uniref:Uncharacterized protein n=1 Tax=Eimeria maxima TaxID=5804 RepID=U6M954_EIMMA|nr:hypothetical protein, conserved [Eimeria maxima]CDJ60757.1 hypothetical protein, conserved [Eimeria maxima]